MSLVIGLTGGIASGKSTVSMMLKEMNIPVIDADIEARKVVEPGEPAYKQIKEVFGEEILLEDGTINRTRLGELIFNNDEKRKRLNAIVHPAVRENMIALKEKYIQRGHSLIVMDIPLLFESKLTHLVDVTLLVFVDEKIQLERLMQRNDFKKEEAMARIRSQMPLSEKKSLSDKIINNNGTIDETRNQLINILESWNEH